MTSVPNELTSEYISTHIHEYDIALILSDSSDESSQDANMNASEYIDRVRSIELMLPTTFPRVILIASSTTSSTNITSVGIRDHIKSNDLIEFESFSVNSSQEIEIMLSNVISSIKKNVLSFIPLKNRREYVKNCNKFNKMPYFGWMNIFHPLYWLLPSKVSDDESNRVKNYIVLTLSSAIIASLSSYFVIRKWFKVQFTVDVTSVRKAVIDLRKSLFNVK